MIFLNNVHVAFKQLEVLKGLSLVIPDGLSMVIMGPSGIGKSVLLKTIIGLIRPSKGSIVVDGYNITKINEKDLYIIRKRFGMVFQAAALFDSLSVFENVAFPVREHSDIMDGEIKRKVFRSLELVGLEEAHDKMPSELSGGMRKRVGIARAIVLNPSYILYDEPTTGLDPSTADSINRLIRSLQTELNITSISVTHDIASASKIGDKWALIEDGKIGFSGTPIEAFETKNPAILHFLNGHTKF